MADDDSLCPLHKCIFNGDIRKLSQLLRTNDPSTKDKHGEWIVINKTNPYAIQINIEIFPVFGLFWQSDIYYLSPLSISLSIFEFCLFDFYLRRMFLHLQEIRRFIYRLCWERKVNDFKSVF